MKRHFALTPAFENKNQLIFQSLGRGFRCLFKEVWKEITSATAHWLGGEIASAAGEARRRGHRTARRLLTGRGSPAERRVPRRPAPRAPRSLRRAPSTRRHARHRPRASHPRAGVGPAALSAPRPARPRRGTGNGYQALSQARFLLSHCLPGNGPFSWESTLGRPPQ